MKLLQKLKNCLLSGGLISIGSSRPNHNFKDFLEMLNEYKESLKTMSPGEINCAKKTICLLHDRPQLTNEIENSIDIIKKLMSNEDQSGAVKLQAPGRDPVTYVLDVNDCSEVDCHLQETTLNEVINLMNAGNFSAIEENLQRMPTLNVRASVRNCVG